jgi:hypothetical protein
LLACLLASFKTITTPTQATDIPSIPTTTQHGKLQAMGTINSIVAVVEEGEEETGVKDFLFGAFK